MKNTVLMELNLVNLSLWISSMILETVSIVIDKTPYLLYTIQVVTKHYGKSQEVPSG